MRTVLTLVAFLLIALLTTALVAPPFIDWTSQRGRIEAEISARLGAPVRISGPIEARLLPIAYARFGGLEIGPPRAPAFVSGAARFEVALGPLVTGRLKFAEIDLDRPALGLDLDAPVRLNVASLALAEAGVEKLVAHGGRLSLRRGGEPPLRLEGVDLSLSAPTLAGPFRGSGAAMTADGRAFGFEFVTTEPVDGRTPVKAEVSAALAGSKATFDGVLSRDARGRPAFSGATTLSGALAALDGGGPLPWKVSGQLTADARAARLDGLTASLGPEARTLNATGRAEATFGDTPVVKATLTAKQLNIDGLLRREGEDAAPPARALAALAALGGRFVDADAPRPGLEIDLSTPAAYIGAATLDDIVFSARGGAGRPVRLAFSSGLPGASQVKLDGSYEFGVAPHFAGTMEASAADLEALGAWAARGDAALTAKFETLARALPYGQVSAKGDLEASKAGFSLRNVTLALDRTSLTGAIALTAPAGGARGRLFVDLATPALDIDAAPNVASGAFWIGDFDLALSLRADRLRVAHAGEGAVESGSLALSATRVADVFKLDKLSVTGLGGASVEAEGEATPSRLWLRATLDAAKLADFAALAQRVAPNRYTRLLVDRAAALSPAKATFEARREGDAKAGPFPFDIVAADGTAGGVRFKARADQAPAPVDALGIEISADATDGGALLGALGLRAPPTPVGKASLHISASGGFDPGFAAEARADFAGATLNWKGRLTPKAALPDDPLAFGQATLKADNLIPALVALGLAGPAARTPAPVDLAADFTWRGDKIAAPRVSGMLAGAKVSAQLAWTPPQEVDVSKLSSDAAVAAAIAGETPPTGGGLSGEVSLDRASAAGLLSLPLGPLAPPMAPARWSEAAFAEPLLIPPLADVTLRIAALDLGGLEARGATARMKTERGKFELADIGFDVGATHVAGRAALRRDGAIAAITGAVDVERLAVERRAVAGGFGLTVEFATSGTTPAGLVAGLVGQGQTTTSGLTLPRLDPLALDRLLTFAEAPDVLVDETRVQYALGKELDKAPLKLPDRTTPLILASGKLRAGPFAVDAEQRHAKTNLAFDLQSFDFAADTEFSSDRVGKNWSGAAPAIRVVASGPLDAPQRKIDDASLSAGLATQAIIRESDRITALEADIRERAYFNRRTKAFAFMDRRAREIADFLTEQTRQQAEKQRADDALLKLLQEQDQAADQPKPAPSPTPAPTPPPRATPADPTANGLY